MTTATLLPPGSATSDFSRSKAGVTFDAGPGDDLVLGSRYADSLKGGTGNDALFGNAGADTLQGGQGLDAVTGGTGSDAFVFAKGDLVTSRSLFNGYAGLVDGVYDFQGAGTPPGTTGSGDQDVLRLEGFGAGTTLAFSGYGLTRSLQFYEVKDPTTPGADGFIFVSMAGGSTRQLTTADVVIVPPPPPPNQAPTFAADSFAFALDENNAAGAPLGAAVATDPEGGALTYAILENADGTTANDVPFAVDAQGRLAATAPLDAEARASYAFTLVATDAGGASDTAQVTVSVTDVEERSLDIAVANAFGDSVSVLVNDGTGGFSAGGGGAPAGDEPRSVALGDLDGPARLTASGLPDLGPLVPVPGELDPLLA